MVCSDAAFPPSNSIKGFVSRSLSDSIWRVRPYSSTSQPNVMLTYALQALVSGLKYWAESVDWKKGN
jgi:hypothetical protein